MGLRLVENKTKSSFKNSELGLIPLDWKSIPISELLEFKNGLNKAKEFFGRGTPIINYMDVFNNAGIRKDNVQGAVTLSKKEIGRYSIKKGDVFFTRTSETVEEIGVSSVLLEDIEDGVFSGFILRGRPKNDLLNIDFKKYCFDSNAVRNQIISTATYTTRALTNGRYLSKVCIPVPKDEGEQERIANALSDVDELIQKLEKLIQKKKLIKKGVMRELLTGKKRLPGYSKLWVRLKLKDISDITMGSSPLSKNYNSKGEGLPLIGGNTDISERKSIDRTFTSEITKVCEKDDIIMTVRAPVGEIAIATNKSCIGRGVCSIRALNKIDQKFIYYKLISLEPEWKKLEQGSTFTSANSDQIKNFELEIPLDPKEQSRLSNILHDLFVEINTLKNKLSKYYQIKAGMMQELLTGRTRLVSNQKDSSKKSVHKSTNKTHNWAINEAVVISTLVHKFGSESYPLGRKRYTKFSYLLHRYKEKQAEGYLKKAAGPYNPSTKYGGPEKIAQQNDYIKKSKVGKFSGFVESDNIDKAIEYFCIWYGNESLTWLEQFRYCKNDELELWATVDMAVQDLGKLGKSVSVEEVKNLINDHEEWRPKLKRPVFSDENISDAISKTNELFNGLT